MQVMMIDDVATTGTSILNGIKELKAEGLSISNACVIINRLEGADKILNSVGVILHQLTDILEITEILFQEKLVSEDILEEIKKQVSQNHS
jgi:orotate phosphoribosyltransferase